MSSAKLLNKREACELLGKSQRSLSDYMNRGRLSAKYVSGPTGRQAMFDPEEVTRLKTEIDTPLEPVTAVTKSSANLTLADFLSRSVQSNAQTHAARPWLTLSEASDWSGLPAQWLLRQARQLAVGAINVGSGKREFWRFNRDALAKER